MILQSPKRPSAWSSNKYRAWNAWSRTRRRVSGTRNSCCSSSKPKTNASVSSPSNYTLNLPLLLMKRLWLGCNLRTISWMCSMLRNWSCSSNGSRRYISSTRRRSRRIRSCLRPTGTSRDEWHRRRTRRRTTRTRSLSWSKRSRGSGLSEGRQPVAVESRKIQGRVRKTANQMRRIRGRAETSRRRSCLGTLGISYKNIRKRGW